MNKVYRLVWNSSQRIWVVASELASAKGKGKASGRSALLCSRTGAGLLAFVILSSQPAGAWMVNVANVTNPGSVASDAGSSTNVAIGSGATVDTGKTHTIAMGNAAKTFANGSIALGNQAEAHGYNSIAQGTGAIAGNTDSIAIGTKATVSVSNLGIAIGSSAKSENGIGNIAIGGDSYARGGDALALGRLIQADAGNSVAIGNQVKTSSEGSIVIAPNYTVPKDPITGLEMLQQIDNASVNAISIGANGETANSKNSIGLGAYTKFSDAENSIGLGYRTIINAGNAIAAGGNAEVSGDSSLAIGAYSKADVARSIALGDNAKTQIAVGTDGTIIGGTNYGFAGTKPVGTLSIGDFDDERTITNVAAGRLTETRLCPLIT